MARPICIAWVSRDTSIRGKKTFKDGNWTCQYTLHTFASEGQIYESLSFSRLISLKKIDTPGFKTLNLTIVRENHTVIFFALSHISTFCFARNLS